MMHIISSPSFTAYSQERLGKAARRVEEPEYVVATTTAARPAQPVARGFFHAFSFDGLRRLFGSAPNVRHS